MKISKYAPLEKTLVVEAHFVFAEPKEWFDGGRPCGQRSAWRSKIKPVNFAEKSPIRKRRIEARIADFPRRAILANDAWFS